MLILAILFIWVCFANDCSLRTSVYSPVMVPNFNSLAFDKNTYLNGSSQMSPQAYRQYVKNNIACTGLWCLGGQWICATDNSKMCYNVEHIIPTANNIQEIAGCSCDIIGNYVMAYGAWNQAMKNEYYGEKVIIYGSVIVKSAYDSVYRACKGKLPTKYPDELCLDEFVFKGNLTPVIVFVTSFCLMIFVVVIAVILRRRCDE